MSFQRPSEFQVFDTEGGWGGVGEGEPHFEISVIFF